VTDGVDASVYAMQPAGLDAALNPACRKSELQQLPMSDDSVLSAGQNRDLAVHLLTFLPHTGIKVRS
jgi:hypothetical protein